MTVVSVAVWTTKSLFGMCDCTVDGDVGKGDFSLVLGNLHVSGHTQVQSYVSPGMDCQALRFTRTPTNWK